MFKTNIVIADPAEPDKIGMEGVVRLLEDLQLDPSSRLVLLLAWKFQAAKQCEFSKEEFFAGMTELGYVKRIILFCFKKNLIYSWTNICKAT